MPEEFEITEHTSVLDFLNEDWKHFEDPHFPFSDYDFLASLEESRSVGHDTGWSPSFLSLKTQGRVVAVLINYTKQHSYGEYIFDWEWARVYQSLGLPYYPKLLSAIPYTPATGSKILVDTKHCHSEVAKECLITELKKTLLAKGYSSSHHLYIPDDETQIFEQAGYNLRHTFQFHWHNPGYESFDDFLSYLKGKKRKNILKERREVSKELNFRTFTGHDITSSHAAEMYRFYIRTIHKMYSQAYLTEDFFHLVFDRMRDRILYTAAFAGEKQVGASICFYKGNNLYGRYWGGESEHKHLHFELCYYQPMNFAIQKKLLLFEAGAQGHHKWQRGFLPTRTLSAHKFRSVEFQSSLETFLSRERSSMDKELERANQDSPFKSLDHLIKSPHVAMIET